MMRACVIDHLVTVRSNTFFNFGNGWPDNKADCSFIEIRDKLAIWIWSQILHGKMMPVLFKLLAEIDNSPFCFFKCPFTGWVIPVNCICKFWSSTWCKIKTTVLKSLKNCCRIQGIRLVFKGFLNNFSLWFTCCKNNGNGWGIRGDGLKTYCNNEPFAGNFNAAQIPGSNCLGFKICFCQACRRIMIGTFAIKSYMPVRTNSPQEKSDPSFLSYLIFIILAPIVYYENRILLKFFRSIPDFPVSKWKIDFIIRKDFPKGFIFSQGISSVLISWAFDRSSPKSLM